MLTYSNFTMGTPLVRYKDGLLQFSTYFFVRLQITWTTWRSSEWTHSIYLASYSLPSDLRMNHLQKYICNALPLSPSHPSRRIMIGLFLLCFNWLKNWPSISRHCFNSLDYWGQPIMPLVFWWSARGLQPSCWQSRTGAGSLLRPGWHRAQGKSPKCVPRPGRHKLVASLPKKQAQSGSRGAWRVASSCNETDMLALRKGKHHLEQVPLHADCYWHCFKAAQAERTGYPVPTHLFLHTFCYHGIN